LVFRALVEEFERQIGNILPSFLFYQFITLLLVLFTFVLNHCKS